MNTETIELPTVPESFSVRDEDSANWVVRKITEARLYIRHAEEWAAREIRRVENEERFFLERYGPQLEDWTRKELARRNGRAKSINLPAGCIGFRTDPQKLEVRDEMALLIWCRVHLPAAIVVQEHVLKSILKNHTTSTGELPTGAEIIGGAERFYIK